MLGEGEGTDGDEMADVAGVRDKLDVDEDGGSLAVGCCQVVGGVSTVLDRRYRAGGDVFFNPAPKMFSLPDRAVDEEGRIGDGGTFTWLVVRVR